MLTLSPTLRIGLLFAYIFFFPSMLFGEIEYGQLFFFITYPAFQILLFFMTKSREGGIYIPSLLLVILGVGLCLLFTIITKVDVLSLKLALGHCRFFVYGLVFFMAYNEFNRLSITSDALKKIFSVIFLASSVFVILHLAFPESSLVKSYTARDAYGFGGFRIGGVFIWSYAYSFVALPFAIMVLIDFFSSKRCDRLYVLSGLGVLLSCLLSQSKSTYLSMALIIVVYLSMCFLRMRFPLRMLISGALIGFLAYHVVINNPEAFDHMIGFISAIQDNRLDGSTSMRMSQLESAFSVVDSPFLSLMFGYPSIDFVIENAYGHYLYRHGVLGLLVYLLLLFLLAVYSGSCYFSQLRNKLPHREILLYWFILSCTLFVFSLSTSPIDGHKTSYFYFTFGALSLSCHVREISRKGYGSVL